MCICTSVIIAREKEEGGRKEERKEGRKEGREEGRKEGREEGRKEGRKRKRGSPYLGLNEGRCCFVIKT